MTVSLFDLRRMDFARKLPERARLMRDDMLRADAAVAAVTAATAAPSADPLSRLTHTHPRGDETFCGACRHCADGCSKQASQVSILAYFASIPVFVCEPRAKPNSSRLHTT